MHAEQPQGLVRIQASAPHTRNRCDVVWMKPFRNAAASVISLSTTNKPKVRENGGSQREIDRQRQYGTPNSRTKAAAIP